MNKGPIFQTSFKKNSYGQTLVEAIIALTVLMLIITALATLTLNSVNNSIFLRNQDNANKYAQEGMDFIAIHKKQDYTVFSSITNGDWCLDYDTATGTPKWPLISVTSSQCYSSYTSFSHTVNILANGCTTAGNNGIQVTLTVGWTDAKCIGGAYCHRAKLQSCFTNSNINPILTITP